jgi:NADH-quinone oxidoreductase subunit N
VSAADVYSLAPYLVLGSVLLVLMMAVAFTRSHRVTMWITVAGITAALFTAAWVADAPQRTVLHLLQIDGYAAYFNILFLLAAAITCLLAYHYLQGRRGELEEFYLLVVTATLGAMVMAAASHFATFVLGLEILSISLYTLVAYTEEEHPPLEAALKYLVLSAVASIMVLFGMALIYNATGSMSFDAISSPANARLEIHLRVGQALMFTGIAFKLSLVPFHMWTPDVYQGAPAPVTGFIATVSKAAVFALLLRLATTGDAMSGPVIIYTLSTLALLSMLVGNLLALMQSNIKRLLAYSSIAHMGYLLIALIAVTRLPDIDFVLTSAMIYLGAYTLMTLAAFGVVTVLSSAKGGNDMQSTDEYRGLFWRQPIAAICLTVAMFALMGMPLTAGFIGKFYLVAAGVQGELWLLLWALIVGSAVSVYYYVKVIYVMTLTDAVTSYPHPTANKLTAVVLVALGLAVVLVGSFPAPLIDFVSTLVADFNR